MKRSAYLLDQLIEYGKSDAYPFHMPGHKRQAGDGFGAGFPNPFTVDMTEIEGFDNLHHPEGILKESMDWAAGIYGGDRTYYLVNGSSCGVLSAVCCATKNGGRILMGRNCHKSAYHGALINRLHVSYVYPQIIERFGIQGGYLPWDVEKLLTEEPDIQAVLLVSPTYDGIASDIGRIARIVHKKGIPLIVDEAHGAHFPYARQEGAPESALALGADVVIQSLHKTLPSFTQTAVMHVREGYLDMDRMDRYVSLFQSSSPSYVLMAGIENCIRWMNGEGRMRMKKFYDRLRKLRDHLERMKNLTLLPNSVTGQDGVFALDETKVIVSCRNTLLSGPRLGEVLRSRFGLEMEMCGSDYVTAITTVADTEEGLDRLEDALLLIDGELNSRQRKEYGDDKGDVPVVPKGDSPLVLTVQRDEDSLIAPGALAAPGLCQPLTVAYTIAAALDSPMERTSWEDGAGKISGEFVYIYPPGIPIVAPGEVLTEDVIQLIRDYRKKGLPVQGMQDKSGRTIGVVRL